MECGSTVSTEQYEGNQIKDCGYVFILFIGFTN